MHSGRGYNEVNIGERYDSALTLTETHIVLGAGLFGDFNPLSVFVMMYGLMMSGCCGALARRSALEPLHRRQLLAAM
jgi:hypothetical protein